VLAQVIRFKVRADAWDRLRTFDERWQAEQVPIAPGFKGSYMLRERGSDNCIFVVLFENAQLAKQNSDRPETNEWHQQLLGLIEGDPEFIDTDVERSYLL
jgi:heme-degrading monooxygenase HmoA